MYRYPPNIYPWYDMFQSRNETTPSMKSYIRLLHASPDAPAVDVYANNKPIAKNLSFKQFTEYLPVPPGQYNIKVFPAGETNKYILEKKLDIPPRSIFTIAAINMLKNLNLLPISETYGSLKPNLSLIRFAHLSPDTMNLDLTLPDGRKLFKDVEYGEVTGYLPVSPRNYTIQLRDTSTNKLVLNVPGAILKPNNFYTFYAVGLSNGTPPLQVLIPLDGPSYLKV